jgi:LacI family transcriptional regulator
MTEATITIDEIARLAGVSKTTVSRVLNNRPDVNRETRERILALIAERDYQPNAFATAISSQKSRNVGLIIPHEADYIFMNPFFVEVLRGISTAIDAHRYSLLVSLAHAQDYLAAFKQKKVDGFIILSPGELHHGIIDALTRAGAPFVSTSRLEQEEGLPYVDVDNVAGGRLAVEHLLDLGHRRIAYVGKPSLTSSRDRLAGYKEALGARGIEVDAELIVIAEGSSERHGYDAVQRLLRPGATPTGMFFANDLLAIGALKALGERQVRVPRQVSLVGFDDVPMAEFVSPPLTTVRQPAFDKGARAAELLLQCLGDGKQPQSHVLDLALVVRRSTARVTDKDRAA